MSGTTVVTGQRATTVSSRSAGTPGKSVGQMFCSAHLNGDSLGGKLTLPLGPEQTALRLID